MRLPNGQVSKTSILHYGRPLIEIFLCEVKGKAAPSPSSRVLKKGRNPSKSEQDTARTRQTSSSFAGRQQIITASLFLEPGAGHFRRTVLTPCGSGRQMCCEPGLTLTRGFSSSTSSSSSSSAPSPARTPNGGTDGGTSSTVGSLADPSELKRKLLAKAKKYTISTSSVDSLSTSAASVAREEDAEIDKKAGKKKQKNKKAKKSKAKQESSQASATSLKVENHKAAFEVRSSSCLHSETTARASLPAAGDSDATTSTSKETVNKHEKKKSSLSQGEDKNAAMKRTDNQREPDNAPIRSTGGKKKAKKRKSSSATSGSTEKIGVADSGTRTTVPSVAGIITTKMPTTTSGHVQATANVCRAPLVHNTALVGAGTSAASTTAAAPICKSVNTASNKPVLAHAAMQQPKGIGHRVSSTKSSTKSTRAKQRKQVRANVGTLSLVDWTWNGSVYHKKDDASVQVLQKPMFGWVAIVDPASNREYYWCPRDGKVQWDVPTFLS
ncbi:unnamed protein product [Amoebophrya sp. A120]|nr:unnamed protein product [Amoebophrya sp. A120]|eukprot:GSA120T00006502001.1